MVENRWLQRRRPLLGTALAVVLGTLLSVASGAAATCPAWPGEPSPRPDRADADPLRARWAELRVQELQGRARALETVAPVEAHRLWRRLLCLGEGGDEARQGAERTRPVEVHRLEVVAAGKARARARGDVWASLDRPVAPAVAPTPKRRPAPDRREAREQLLRSVDHWLKRTEVLLADARFEEALESASDTRGRLKRIRWEPDVDARWVYLEVLEATIQVARGEEDAAHACARRALHVDPDLHLDSHQISPKVVEVFEAAAEEEGAR